MNEYSQELRNKIKDYYTKVYESVGLKNVEEKVSMRMREEEEDARRIIDLESIARFSFGRDQKHLIVGTGTGGLAVELFKRGCQVYGIDPNEEANEITKLKAKELGMPVDNFTTDIVESLPFNDNTFDFIHCFSVIEHVSSVKGALAEMIRVLKPGIGCICLNTPDYRFPYEGHYKIIFPTFLPKIFGYLYLLIKGRPVKFLRDVKYVTEGNINKILYKQPVIWQRIYRQYPPEWDNPPFYFFLWRFFSVHLNVPKNQEILIRKKT